MVSGIRNHWWWRPGMRPGRRVDTFYVTFDGLTAVRELAESARRRLSALPGLDLVPDQWLHLTMQEVGFSDEVTGTELAAIVTAATDGLVALAPVTVTVGSPVLAGEGIFCPVTPAGGLGPARDAVRAAIGQARGSERVPDSAEWARWSPHVSLAYANADGPGEPFEAALDGLTDVATVTVRAVDLIRFGRDRHLYEWETIARLPLGG